MFLEKFQTTTVNTKQNQDTYGMQLHANRCDNRTRSDASVLVWRVLFRLFIVAHMLLDHHCEHQAKTRHVWHAARRQSLRQSDQVRCFAARLENFFSVVYSCLHAPRNISDPHREYQAKTRHVWHAAPRRSLRQSDQVRCFGARLKNFISVVYSCSHAPRNISDHHREH